MELRKEKFAGGSNQITERLAELVNKSGNRVVLNSPVIKVEHKDEQGTKKVEITTSNGLRILSDYVISSLPPTQIVKIEFIPQLPFGFNQMCQRVSMGSFIKCICIYKTFFWREQGFSGEIICGNTNFEKHPISFVFDGSTEYKEEKIPALVVFLSSEAGLIWSPRTKEERKQVILKQLCTYYGEEALHPLDYLEQDWNSHKWTRGCPVNIHSTGSMNLRNFHPFENLHFAGTETASKWNGYMSGAVEAGLRSANEVLERLKGIPSKHTYQISRPKQKKTRFNWFYLAVVCVLFGILLFIMRPLQNLFWE